jgi:hypothetical protein
LRAVLNFAVWSNDKSYDLCRASRHSHIAAWRIDAQTWPDKGHIAGFHVLQYEKGEVSHERGVRVTERTQYLLVVQVHKRIVFVSVIGDDPSSHSG